MDNFKIQSNIADGYLIIVFNLNIPLFIDITYLIENSNISFINCVFSNNQATNLIFHCFSNNYLDGWGLQLYQNFAGALNIL